MILPWINVPEVLGNPEKNETQVQLLEQLVQSGDRTTVENLGRYEEAVHKEGWLDCRKSSLRCTLDAKIIVFTTRVEKRRAKSAGRFDSHNAVF